MNHQTHQGPVATPSWSRRRRVALAAAALSVLVACGGGGDPSAPSIHYRTVGSYPITDCVKDNITGLTWEGKTATGWRAGSNGYTHYDNTAAAQFWDGASPVNPTQAQMDAASNSVGYKNAVNASKLCGYTNWRLPTTDELLSLVDRSAATGAMVDATWFPNVGDRYWSSSPYADLAANAWFVNFSNGSVGNSDRYGSNFQVRLVR